ncbi:aerobic respiration control sensor protein arcB [Cercophora newfieldiana]|uniref:Aerobic respiration control sensor protein arcB n=1 Tax=Cercophora newfieldiana TaxID=92897 RepID=A0AA39YGE2_9PEZI|nr:aerobic respiration control sensor protein arcB [Cercophora newfieldiana]
MGSSVGIECLKVCEVLDADPRPTFVIDLDPDEDIPVRHPNGAQFLLPAFCNAALRLHEQLFDALVGTNAQGLDKDADEKETPGRETYKFADFKKWVTGVTPHDESGDIFPLSFLYGDMLWTGSTVQKRWRLVSGNRLWRDTGPLRDLSSGSPPDIATGGLRAEQAEKKKKAWTNSTPAGTTIAAESAATRQPTNKTTGSSDDTGASSLSTSIILSTPEKAVVDWTSSKPKGILSPHIQYARSVNWAATPLGPMEKWSPEFRQTANLCMSNPHPAALFWGSELTMLYNEAYAAEVAGNKHPSLMGTGFSGPFAELWDYTGPVFAECARTGISVRKEDDYLPINRFGMLEETWFSWSFTPLYGGTGRIQGFYNAPFETTKQVLSHRRMRTINKIGECTAQAKAVKQFWKLVLDGLQDNERDVPFALLYSVGDGDDGDHSSMSSGSTISLKTCHLEGSIGVPEGHIAAPANLDLKRSREGFIPAFREAMRTREPTLLHTRDGTLPEALLDGINWRGFGDPCREAIIFPVRPTNGDAVLAFLVLGVNPRRPYDGEYVAFTSMLNRQFATSLASVILFEDETRRNRDAVEAAALEKQQLTQQLDLQASRLRRMTELSPLGMFLISPQGVLREANDRFYEMTGHSREGEYEMSWMDFMTDDSARVMQEGWERLAGERQPWSCELQLRKSSPNPVDFEGESMECWVLLAASPELVADGSLRSIMGSITDISHLKWAQGLQNRRLQEAEETRRQQNEFIDITSHEMRNPLSAILQCADDISSALAACLAEGTSLVLPSVESCLDAAQTITLCVQHQKSIVDDILTISKLDSNLLLITPVPSQPAEILRRAVSMFDPELKAKDINVSFDIDASYTAQSVDWVTIDPSRVLQILINLLTNAIKFTAPATERLITVTLAASTFPPDGGSRAGFQYVPSNTEMSAVATSEEWGKGEVLYLRFDVRDSGCGLTPSEKQMLFQRFKQASPRTHAQYGGSGLGLFISKRLAELHGGQIGVASEAGGGSVFGFFIQARRCDMPRDDGSRDAPLPIETHLGGSTSLNSRPTPQRQDYASSASIATASLITTGSSSAEVASMPLHLRPLNPSEVSILVVEDNLINQKVLVKQLRKHGCAVSVANDGIECLGFLETTHFLAPGGVDLSVILMDLEMPNMDGLTCVREIRRMEKEGRMVGGRKVPVVAVTANVRDEQIANARGSGMDDVVSKPFRIEELWGVLERLLREG